MHVPFCRRRCDYCAFATWTDRHHLADAYVEACVREATGLAPATSVFVGGGTPSQLAGAGLARILDAIARTDDCEVTVEANPDDVTADLLAAYRDAGVNRLSLGVQSMVPHVLAALGREHDRAAVARAVELAGAAGFASSYSVDLIYGAVGESLADWEASVAGVLALEPSPAHVSAYGLTIEPGTPLAADPSRHPDPDDQADKYEMADDLLGTAGLGWYEVSNWARAGAECAHNLLYWRQGDYRGIGAAAHSHAATPDGGARRWWNVRTPERFIRLVSAGASAEAAGESLDVAGRRAEQVALALRTREGAAVGSVAPDGLASVAEAGLVTVERGRVVLTRAGRLLGNEVTVRLMPAA